MPVKVQYHMRARYLMISATKLIWFGIHPSHSKNFGFMIEPLILPSGEQPPINSFCKMDKGIIRHYCTQKGKTVELEVMSLFSQRFSGHFI